MSERSSAIERARRTLFAFSSSGPSSDPRQFWLVSRSRFDRFITDVVSVGPEVATEVDGLPA